ncbi:MAG TPA: family 16 glycosylhydrolase [Fibrobacteraceae bacterium]|nr:family 16 glycosylhydrolase [Fibrobacteraceae bacterium]
MKGWKYCFLICGVTIVLADDYGAEVYTKEAFRFGRFEARMCMAAASGTVSSMFLYYPESYAGDPEPWREIDIEVLGKSPAKFQSNIITGYAGEQTTSEALHTVDPATNVSYHTYAVEWTPDYVAWSVDSVEIRRDTGEQVTDLQDEDQTLRFNLWASTSTSWAGAWSDTVLPQYQFINWVRVYSYDSSSGFSLLWQDDFNEWDASVWAAGNWTFTGNRITFTAENAVVQDGFLILALTDDNTGFSGNAPIDDSSSTILGSTSSKAPFLLRYGGGRIQVFGETCPSCHVMARTLDGRQIASRNLSGNRTDLLLGKYPDGIILVSIESADKIWTSALFRVGTSN